MILELALGSAGGLVYAARNYKGAPYADLFALEGNRFGIDAQLLKAIAHHESGFNADAVSHPNKDGTRDFGLMQINERNLQALGLNGTTALDPSQNVHAGAKLFSQLGTQLGDRDSFFARIAAYNIGAGTVRTYGITNWAYVADVFEKYVLWSVGALLYRNA